MKKNRILFAGERKGRIFTPVITTTANKMKTTTQLQGATIITTHEGHELIEAVLIGKGRKLDCWKKANGNYSVSLEKVDAARWGNGNKVLRIYELGATEFFAYWDKKLNEWK